MNVQPRVAILGSGAGSNARAIIAAQNVFQYNVPVLLTTSERSGFHHVGRDSSIPVFWHSGPAIERDQWIIAMCQEHSISILALAGYMRLIGTAVLEHVPMVVNIHPSLLPLFGGVGMYGMHVHNAVFEAKAATSGATVHQVTDHYDQGPIILQQSIEIPKGSTPVEICELVRSIEHQLYPKALHLALKSLVR
jgi:phosphoribosylglycinamide formyltransferase 1